MTLTPLITSKKKNLCKHYKIQVQAQGSTDKNLEIQTQEFIQALQSTSTNTIQTL